MHTEVHPRPAWERLLEHYERQVTQRGDELDQRLRGVAQILEVATRPESVRALQQILEQLPVLADSLEQAPGIAATAFDTLDEWAHQLVDQGCDPEKLAHLAIRLGIAASTLEANDLSDHPPESVTAWGLYRAMKEPAVQRALGLGLKFARAVGQSTEPASDPTRPLDSVRSGEAS